MVNIGLKIVIYQQKCWFSGDEKLWFNGIFHGIFFWDLTSKNMDLPWMNWIENPAWWGFEVVENVWDFTSWFLGRKRLSPRVNCSRSSPTAFFWKKIWGFCWEVAEKKKKSHWKLIVYDILWSEKLHLHLCKKRSIPVFVSMWWDSNKPEKILDLSGYMPPMNILYLFPGVWVPPMTILYLFPGTWV